MEKQRFITLDIVRALAILLVVIGHYSPDAAPEWYKVLNKIIYTFHMPVFLFVSGYVYIATKKDESYFTFLFKKVKRLLVPYFSTSVIIILIKLLTQGEMYVQNPVSAKAFIEMFYLPVAGYFLWFVLALWWMFVIVPWFKTRIHRLALFIATVIFAFAPFELTDVMCMNQFKKMFIYFMTGVIAYDFKDYIVLTSSSLWKAIVTCVIFAITEIFYLKGSTEYIQHILPFMGIITMIQLSEMLCNASSEIIKKGLLYCGSASYIIYLFHTTFEGFCKSIITKVLYIQSEGILFILGTLFVIGLGIIGPLCLNEVLKRNAITRFLFGLK